MNATKRKFNALLQGLNSNAHPDSPSNPSMAGSNTAGGPLPLKKTAAVSSMIPNSKSDLVYLKRRRIDGIGEPAAASLRGVTSSSTAARPSPSTRHSSTVHPRNNIQARFCPSDRQELLKRLGTFQELTDWSPKPERVSEIEWAKRGWICQGKDTVRCLLCHKEVVVKFSKRGSDGSETVVLVASEVANALIEKYSEMIVTSHQDDCLWRKRGCESVLLRIPLANAEASHEALRARYDELCSRKPFLPYEFNLRLPEGFVVDNILEKLPQSLLDDPTTKASVAAMPAVPNKVALALALCGWQGLTNPRIGTVSNTASCHTCLRRLGLWMFKSKEVDDEGNILVPAPMDHLDPIREHRFFCPWKNGQIQSRSPAQTDVGPALAGWSELLRTIKNDAHLRNVYSGHDAAGAQTDDVFNVVGIDGGADHSSTSGVQGTTDAKADGGGADAVREAKDKERWARLRKVKSLFDTKGKKLIRPLSRPGTSNSNRSGMGKE